MGGLALSTATLELAILRADSFRFNYAGSRYNRACANNSTCAYARPLVINYINYTAIISIAVLPSQRALRVWLRHLAIWCREKSGLLIFFINFNKKESFCPSFLTVPTSFILYFTFQSLFTFSKSLGFSYILGFNFIRIYHFIICSNFITWLYLSKKVTSLYL